MLTFICYDNASAAKTKTEAVCLSCLYDCINRQFPTIILFTRLSRESCPFFFSNDKLSAHSLSNIIKTTNTIIILLHNIILPFKMHFTNYKYNASFVRLLERKVMTHAAVAPGNPEFLDEDIERRLVGTNSLKIVQGLRRKERTFKLT